MRKPHRIQVETAYVECPFCPATYIGRTYNGQTVYARYRSGVLSVRFDPRSPAPHGGAWGLVLMEGQFADADDGHMTYAELRERSQNVVNWPEELSQHPPDEGDTSETNQTSESP